MSLTGGYTLAGFGSGLEKGIAAYLTERNAQIARERQGKLDDRQGRLDQSEIDFRNAGIKSDQDRNILQAARYGWLPDQDIPPIGTTDTVDHSSQMPRSLFDGQSLGGFIAQQNSGGLPTSGLSPVGPPPPITPPNPDKRTISIGGTRLTYNPDADPQSLKTASALEQIKLRASLQPPHNPTYGSPEWRQAEIDKADIGREHGYHPPREQQLVQVQGPDGDPIWVPKDQAVGQKAKTTTRIESATNTAATARLTAAVSEMNNANAGMAEFEAGLKSGKYTINGLQQFAGRIANSFTHDDPLSMTLQSASLATLNKTNPELARYIRRGLSFAEGESMISQRPSDFRTKMSAFLSQAASGASPEMIADIESRRMSILNPLNAVVGQKKSQAPVAKATPAASSGDINLGAPSKKPVLSQAEYDAGRKTFSDAEIAKHYDLAGVRRSQ